MPKIKTYKLDLDDLDENKIVINTKIGNPISVFFNTNGELFVNILHFDVPSFKENTEFIFYIYQNNEEIELKPLKFIGTAFNINSIGDIRIISNMVHVYYYPIVSWYNTLDMNK